MPGPTRSILAGPGRAVALVSPRLRRLAMTALLSLLALVVLANFVTARQTTAVPPNPTFDGWIVVLADAPNGSGRVALRVSAVQAGAPGDAPAVRIQVTVCGMDGRKLVLLLADNARLDDGQVVHAAGELTTGAYESLVISDVAGQSSARADADVLILKLDSTMSCIEGIPPHQVALIVEGRLGAPVAHQASLLGAQAARHSQTWPMLGSPPGIGTQSLGVFSIDPIDGIWERPPQTNFSLFVGELSLPVLIETADPEITAGRDLAWDSDRPFEAKASLVDMSELSFLQSSTAFLAILFGLLGSVVAGLFVERLHREPRISIDPVVNAPVDPRGHLSTQSELSRSCGVTRSVTAAALILFVLFRSVRRRRQ